MKSSKSSKSMTSVLFASTSSSSSDDENSSSGPPPRHLVGVTCSNARCDQELLCVSNKDYYCSRDCYYSKLERDKIGDTGITLKRITSVRGRGGTGLLQDRSTLDHLTISVDDVMGRTVTVHNSGFNASRWKKQCSQKKGKILPEKKPTNEGKCQRNEQEKQRLRELLGGGGGGSSSTCSSSEESTSHDDDKEDEKTVIESAQEEIQTLLSSGVNASICPLHPPVGKNGTRLKGYVINVISPWELYIQTEDMVTKTHSIDAICNRPEGIDPRLVSSMWLPQVGAYCTAKYEDKLYRAKILETVDSNKFLVKYVDYGNIGVVPRSEVLQLNPELSLIPRQYFFFKMSNVKPLNSGTKWTSEICQFLMDNLDGGIVEVEIESVERGVIHWGKLKVLSSISGQVLGDFGNSLVERGMANSDSFYL